MRKIALLFLFALFTLAATAQEFKVIDKKPIDSKAKERIQMSFEKITKMQRDFYKVMKVEDVLNDSIYFKGKIDTLMTNMWTVHKMFEYQMSVPDTIIIYQKSGKFYQDTTKVDLITERQQLVARYQALVAKYGELTEYESNFQEMKKRFDQLADWQKQIVNQLK